MRLIAQDRAVFAFGIGAGSRQIDGKAIQLGDKTMHLIAAGSVRLGEYKMLGHFSSGPNWRRYVKSSPQTNALIVRRSPGVCVMHLGGTNKMAA